MEYELQKEVNFKKSWMAFRARLVLHNFTGVMRSLSRFHIWLKCTESSHWLRGSELHLVELLEMTRVSLENSEWETMFHGEA